MDGFRNGLQSFGLLIARLGLGGILLLHGWLHWRVGVPRLVETYISVGAPYAQIAAWATIIFELVAGIFLIVGALTRVIGAGMVTLSVLNISYLSYSLGPELLRPTGRTTAATSTTSHSACSVCCSSSSVPASSRSTGSSSRKKPTTEEEDVDAPPVPHCPDSTAVAAPRPHP